MERVSIIKALIHGRKIRWRDEFYSVRYHKGLLFVECNLDGQRLLMTEEDLDDCFEVMNEEATT